MNITTNCFIATIIFGAHLCMSMNNSYDDILKWNGKKWVSKWNIQEITTQEEQERFETFTHGQGKYLKVGNKCEIYCVKNNEWCMGFYGRKLLVNNNSPYIVVYYRTSSGAVRRNAMLLNTNWSGRLRYFTGKLPHVMKEVQKECFSEFKKWDMCDYYSSEKKNWYRATIIKEYGEKSSDARFPCARKVYIYYKKQHGGVNIRAIGLQSLHKLRWGWNATVPPCATQKVHRLQKKVEKERQREMLASSQSTKTFVKENPDLPKPLVFSPKWIPKNDELVMYKGVRACRVQELYPDLEEAYIKFEDGSTICAQLNELTKGNEL